jgi:hypothetical protein
MDMQLVSSSSGLLQLNSALQYLQDLHNGCHPDIPDVSDAHMTAAMEAWINRRKHVLGGIRSGFSDLEKAREASLPTADIMSELVKRIENYNGIFMPRLMDSFEAATGTTPIEGWLFKMPPREWRLFGRTQFDLRPIDHSGLFFQRKHSYYLTFTEGLSLLALGAKHFVAGYALLATGVFLVGAHRHARYYSFDMTAAILVSLGILSGAITLMAVYLIGAESHSQNNSPKDK